MKLFLDSANIEEIKKAYDLGLIAGVTTNPTLIAKQLSSQSLSEQKKVLSEICKISKEIDVLAEPVSTDYESILQESIELSEVSPQIVAKIPITTEGLMAVKALKERKIRTALTLIFSVPQAIVAASLGVDYICPFVGRLDDIGQTGTDLVRDIMTIYKNYNIKTKVIVASVRNINHIIKSAEYAADAVTIPFKLISEMITHELTTKGVQKFLDDWNKLKK